MKKPIFSLVILGWCIFVGCQKQPSRNFSSSTDQGLVDYLHFAQKQYLNEPNRVLDEPNRILARNCVLARVRGYLDAKYDYIKTENADLVMEIMVMVNGLPQNSDQAVLWLNRCYQILSPPIPQKNNHLRNFLIGFAKGYSDNTSSTLNDIKGQLEMQQMQDFQRQSLEDFRWMELQQQNRR